MKPISELTFEHGKVIVGYKVAGHWYIGVGSLLVNGRIGIAFSGEQHEKNLFTHFLPLSEIEQLKELPR
jgi:hypothetical protein